MSKKLEQIRTQIDALDNQIHDLLMERAGLIREVAAEKNKSNRPIVHPAREAKMIRRLLNRHSGILPQAAIVGIWRELVGGVSMLQRGLHVHVVHSADQEYCWDMAKNYFGSVLPMNRVSGDAAALSAVRNDRDALAVMPWPSDDDHYPWWLSLVHQDETQRMIIAGALPYGGQVPLEKADKKALILGRMEYNPSGEDHSFIVIQVDGPLSRARVIEWIEGQELSVLSIVTSSADSDEEKTAHLIEVGAYISEGDKRLQAIQGKVEEQNGLCVALGGYPVPPIFRQGDTDPIEVKDV